MYRTVASTSYGMGLLGALLIYALGALVTLNVILRVADKSITGLTEYASMALVLIAFLGLAYTEREDGHIRIDIVVSRLSPRVQRVLETITCVLSVPFLIVLVRWTAQMAQHSYRLGSTTMQTSVDVWIIQMFVPLGLAMWSLAMVMHIKDIWSKN